MPVYVSFVVEGDFEIIRKMRAGPRKIEMNQQNAEKQKKNLNKEAALGFLGPKNRL